MSLFTRIFRAILGVKEAPYTFGWREGNPYWRMKDTDSYMREGWGANALIYAAIMYKARAIALTRMQAYRGDEDNNRLLDRQHPLSKLLRRPNPHQSWIEFEGLNTAWFNIAGEAFVYVDRDNPRDTPRALYPLHPNRVLIIPAQKGIQGYLYLPVDRAIDNGIPLLPDSVMHVKLPNPMDELEGMGYGWSPMAALAQSGDVDNAITHFLKKFFERGAMPNGILKFNNPMDETTIKAIKRRWSDAYGGVDKWTDIGVLDSQGEYQRIGMTFNEMGFETLDERNESRILSPLGVPGILLDTRISMKNSTYANKAEARKAFWEDTMTYEMMLWDEEYQHILNVGDVFVKRDLSHVPALQKNTPELVGAAKVLWDMGVPSHQAFRVVGLNVGELPSGDVGYVSSSVVRVDEVGTPAPEPAKQERKAERPEKWTTEQKAAHGDAVDAIAVSHEDEAREAGLACFEKDRRAVLKLVQDAEKKAYALKQTIDWLTVDTEVLKYLTGQSKLVWAQTFIPVVSGVIEDTGDYWSAQTGLAWDVRNLLGEAWFENYMLVFGDPIAKTSADTLHDILALGQAEGWSMQKMEDAISLTFQGWMTGNVDPDTYAFVSKRLPAYRIEMIARTETIRAAGAGAQALFESWELEEREWLSTRDGRTRPTHVLANGQRRLITEAFSVGGWDMMHPGDASRGAPPKEFVNCRCTIIPVMKE